MVEMIEKALNSPSSFNVYMRIRYYRNNLNRFGIYHLPYHKLKMVAGYKRRSHLNTLLKQNYLEVAHRTYQDVSVTQVVNDIALSVATLRNYWVGVVTFQVPLQSWRL